MENICDFGGSRISMDGTFVLYSLVIESKNSADHARNWVIQSADGCSNQQRIHVVIPGDICLDTQVGHWIRCRHGHLATEQTNGWAKKARKNPAGIIVNACNPTISWVNWVYNGVRCNWVYNGVRCNWVYNGEENLVIYQRDRS